MIHMFARGLGALVLTLCAFSGVAQTGATPLPAAVTQLVAASSAAPPTQISFTISPAQDLQVTLKDLKIPSALTSANVVVTHVGVVIASAQIAPTSPAVALIPAASGAYTMYVFGVPGTQGVGTFSACVAPKANPTNCIPNASIVSGNMILPATPSGPTVSNVVLNVTITDQDSYKFTFTDLQFPTPLSVAPTAILSQGVSQIASGITTGTTMGLGVGVYQLIVSAQADPTLQAGLYSIMISGAAGSIPLPTTAVPVGLTTASQPFSNPSAQSVALTVTDFGFPGPLARASALLATAGSIVGAGAGGVALGTANAAGGSVTLRAPAGTLSVFTYGNAGSTAGTYSVDVAAGTTDLFTTVQGVSLPGSNAYAYAFLAPIAAAGAYSATATDLQFPSQMTALSFAVAQNGVILQQSATPGGSLTFNASGGNAVLLVGAQSATGGSAIDSGFFDVNVQSGTQTVFDQTQNISVTTTGTTIAAVFSSQPVTVVSGASLTATLADLMLPAALNNVGMVISRGSQVSGKIFGSDTLSFLGSAGTYQLTFFAIPATTQQFGLYTASLNLSSSPPAITLTSSAASAVTGSSITLSWTVGNAASCSATGGAWSGSDLMSATSTSVVLSATTTYTMTCTGPGGTATQSVTVTATAPTTSTSTTTPTSTPNSGHSGGGSIDIGWLLMGASVLTARRIRQWDPSLSR